MRTKLFTVVLLLLLATSLSGNRLAPLLVANNPNNLLVTNNADIELGEYCYADIDTDGVEELINITWFGSGICVTQIDVYRNNQWIASMEPIFGYIDLVLEKVDEHSVKLLGRWEVGDGLVYTKDFGKLMIRQDGDQYHLKSEADPQDAIKTGPIEAQVAYFKKQMSNINNQTNGSGNAE